MKKLLLRTISLIVGVAAIVVLIYKPDWTYLACEAARGINSQVKVEETSAKAMKLKEYQVNELLQDKRIKKDQSLILINPENKISDSFHPDLTSYKSKDIIMNPCMVNAYTSLVSEVRKNTKEPIYINCSYRTKEMQREAIAQYGKTATSVNASEHQAGLALDIYCKGYAGHAFIKSKAGQYVNSNCWKYGFIIRYPYYGKDKTGISYEPWHIRYVGVPHAKIMYKNHMTMEEYFSSLKEGVYYKYDGYLIIKQSQKQQKISLPEDFQSGIVSSDNQGNYIITLKFAK